MSRVPLKNATDVLRAMCRKVGTFEVAELKDCPFCGNEQVVMENTVTEAQVRCTDVSCGATIKRKHRSLGDLPTLERLVRLWNKRT